MGILKWLFGKPTPRPHETRDVILTTLPDPPPNGRDYPYEAVGESHYQRELSQICGGKTEDGYNLQRRAELRPEPNNPHDKNAVAVHISGKKVGYLSRKDAIRWNKHLAELGRPGATTGADAMITGGWLRRDGRDIDEGDFGVRLRL
ncbi:HIRAN domain-containing protein [Paracoccus sp. SSJ]|uniref:HIRAN domain-containing protein n=1 Tax=Paracoccus sp. SSJ TaxID=3050636 RepID=UPI00091B7A9E|nr:HIRAN domain-containing protein [Paracoccus sp. SSJ]MDK8871514.1 HIRAN domain-containing protein [Paracoccus sp. SSJ]SFY23055.1 HIRAN domain-containing protein [Paracoccus pantotrophus]